MKAILKIFALIFSAILMSSCEDYLGEKTDLSFIEVPQQNFRQVAYVPIQPALTDFGRPVDIVVGFDELLYVVDEASEEIIAMDEAGRIIGRKHVPGAKAVAQDRRFDLLVLGRTDTVINPGNPPVSFATIFRIRLIGNSGYGLNNSEIINKVVHPFYSRGNVDPRDQDVEFNRISVIGGQTSDRNNQYYVTRTGDGTAFQQPYDAVLWFDYEDNFISTISVNTSSGLFRDYFEEPHGITTLTQPPQLTATTGGDFIFTSLEPGNALKVQYIEFAESDLGAEFRPQILASGGDTAKADGFINLPFKFDRPLDVTIAGDASRYIFVADAGSDSVYQFTSTGLEGVLPPPATGITKYQKASFGGTGSSLTQFREPMAVAYFNEILYVADAGNGRILRFKLTTDFD